LSLAPCDFLLKWQLYLFLFAALIFEINFDLKKLFGFTRNLFKSVIEIESGLDQDLGFLLGVAHL